MSSKAPTPKQTSKAPTPGTSTPVTGTGPGTKPLNSEPNSSPSSSLPQSSSNTRVDDLPPLPPPAASNPSNSNATTPVTANPPSTHVPGALLLPGEQAPAGMKVTAGGEVIDANAAGGGSSPQDNNNNQQHNDDDDDDDDDSDASSDGYDFSTGEAVVREEMSPRRKQEILERAMRKREDETTMRIVNTIKPLPPRRTAQSIRMRSREIIDEAREVIALDIGVPPRVFRDEATGYILPRESVVTIAKPISVEDEKGNVSLVAAPTSGYGLSKEFDAIEKEKVTEQTTTTHYQRSVEALRYAQQQRLIRQLNIEQQ